jgi:hypothetical protein
MPIMRRLLLIFLMITFIVSSCRGEVAPPSQVDDSDMDNSVIQWSDYPSHIVFQADTVSYAVNEDELNSRIQRTTIPPCTIYGDGRVIWTVQSDDPLNSVLVGPVDPPRIRSFVNYLVLADIYNKIQLGDLESERPPFVETLRLNVNDVEHNADIFGGLTADFYYEALERCQNLSPRPQIYRPDAIWLYVQEQPYDSSAPSIIWETAVTGVDLASIADSGEPRWIEGRVVHLLWAYRLRSSESLQYSQDGRNFLVLMEIPNVTRASPPIP